jgi:hypothetical protein
MQKKEEATNSGKEVLSLMTEHLQEEREARKQTTEVQRHMCELLGALAKKLGATRGPDEDPSSPS